MLSSSKAVVWMPRVVINRRPRLCKRTRPIGSAKMRRAMLIGARRKGSKGIPAGSAALGVSFVGSGLINRWCHRSPYNRLVVLGVTGPSPKGRGGRPPIGLPASKEPMFVRPSDSSGVVGAVIRITPFWFR